MAPLAKGPDSMANEIVASRGRGADKDKDGVTHHHVTDTSSPQQRLLRQALTDESWNLYRWLLDTCELTARDERSWKVQRRLILDAIHQHEKNQRNLVNSILNLSPEQIMQLAMSGGGVVGNGTDTAKENTNGTGKE